jgi:hypothetical protein
MLGETTPFIRNLFTLGGCSNIIGAEVKCPIAVGQLPIDVVQVFSYRTEVEMLTAWRAFMIQYAPVLVALPLPCCACGGLLCVVALHMSPTPSSNQDPILTF